MFSSLRDKSNNNNNGGRSGDFPKEGTFVFGEDFLLAVCTFVAPHGLLHHYQPTAHR